jgi:membrane-bound lytic murein transglycosylase A
MIINLKIFKHKFILIYFLAIISLQGCSVFKCEYTAKNSLVKIEPYLLNDLSISAPNNLTSAVNSSNEYFNKTTNQLLQFGYDDVLIKDYKKSLSQLIEFLKNSPNQIDFNNYIKNNFDFYKTTAPRTLITGYYVPVIEGSLTKNKKFYFPLYYPPGGNDKFLSRKEIDSEKKLEGKNLEIIYLTDPIEAFFAQIQGSVRIKLPDGKIILARYADKNGHPYKPIGKLLIEQGYLTKENVSMNTIKEVLRKNTNIIEETLNWNPSYVFFRLSYDNAKGSLGTDVIENLSIATDQKLFPKGAIGLLQLDNQWRIIFNHDTGGAIRGPGRVDLFLGEGEKAGNIASGLQSYGELVFLAPKK